MPIIRVSSDEGKPHSSKKGRRAESQRAYKRQFGEQKKQVGKAAKRLTGDDPVIKWLAGGVKGKPHSSKEGRLASAGRKFSRITKGLGKPGPSRPPRRPWKPKPTWEKRAPMKPLRAKHGLGSLVKKIVSKIKIKPKPKGKEQRFLDFIETGKAVDKHGVKVNVAKAAERLTGRPHVDHGKRKRIKHLGKGKAEGGRIGLRHGGSVGAAVRGHGAEIK
jgi:hypothetical protein